MRPPKLRPGAHVRVVAPSRSLAVVGVRERTLAQRRLRDLGFSVSFGRHVEEVDEFHSSSVRSRIEDLHEAFADPTVDAILTVFGGFNTNQLLDHIDWELISANPKVLCGYSDITALQNAILARAGLVTYSGPHYSTFGMRDHFKQTLEWFEACLFGDQPLVLQPSRQWSNDPWFVDQDNRTLERNDGWWVIQPGRASGQLVGGNLCTFNLLQGTRYMPELSDAIVLVEDDAESQPHHFDRDLQSLLQQPGADRLQGVLVGRFERASGMTRDALTQIVGTKRQLRGVPVIANVDFGHTDPLVTLPIGGRADITAEGRSAQITITEH